MEQGLIASDVDGLTIENDIDEMAKAEVDVLTTKFGTLQTRFRAMHVELQMMLNDENEQLHEKTLSTIKDTFKQLKLPLKSLRHEEETKRNQQQ